LVSAKKDGKAFHRLVHAIESAIAIGNANTRVETSKRIADKVTGRPREHDVVLTIAQEHHELVIALECRDHSRKIDVGAVEAFRSKCEHTGINSGIIVSARGFYKPAIQKAASYDIRCLTLDEAESFDWCPASGVETFLREIRGSNLTVLFDDGGSS
jgi:predicted helicase